MKGDWWVTVAGDGCCWDSWVKLKKQSKKKLKTGQLNQKLAWKYTAFYYRAEYLSISSGVVFDKTIFYIALFQKIMCKKYSNYKIREFFQYNFTEHIVFDSQLFNLPSKTP